MAEREPPTQDLANLHLDEVTGERVSKSELKKRQKQRETERKKAEKAASAAPKQAKKKDEGVDESELNPNVCLSLWAFGLVTDSFAAILRNQKWTCQPP